MTLGTPSIRRRLIGITMAACGTALLLSGGGSALFEYFSTRRHIAERLDSIADIVGNQSTAALTFDDRRAAAEILKSLEVDSHIVAATLRDREGKVFALYLRPGVPRLPCPDVLREGQHLNNGILDTLRPVLSPEGERMGTVCVHSNLDEIWERLRISLLVLGGIFAFSLLAAFGLVSGLERQITGPLLRLTRTVKAVSERKDYSIRAEGGGRDETGLLVEGFNEMLAQIQERDARLEAARADLERRVEERTRELRAKEQQLIQAQKMEAIGRLAGGVAHDFNNMLTAILGFAELATQNLPPEDPNRGHLQEIASAARRAKALTAQLLAFGRRQMLQPEILDLNAVVQGFSEMLRRLLGEGVTLALELDPAAGPILADPNQIQQVILNLAVNARDAMPGGGRVTLRTCRTVLHEPISRREERIPAGEYTTFSVSDTGPGLAPEVLPHLFEPFFTTKPKGQGTGLGLSTVYGIVKQSGGFMTVESPPGGGATFTVYFPRAASGAPKTEARSPSDPPVPATRGTVLLAEDELVVRKLAREVLHRQGFTVVEAADGQEALRIFKEAPDRFDILVTDVLMPVMDGRELVRQASTLRPALKVLFMSGYTDDTTFRRHLGDRRIGFLPKPFTPGRLAAKVQEVLSGVSAAGNPEVSHETHLDLRR